MLTATHHTLLVGKGERGRTRSRKVSNSVIGIGVSISVIGLSNSVIGVSMSVVGVSRINFFYSQWGILRVTTMVMACI